jgi:hypothetical protein
VTVELTVTNPNAEGRDGRVVVFYAHRSDQQYARYLGAGRIYLVDLDGGGPCSQEGTRGQGSGGRKQEAGGMRWRPKGKNRKAQLRVRTRQSKQILKNMENYKRARAKSSKPQHSARSGTSST